MSVENFSPLKNLKQDLPASVVVFLVALPLCLGVAMASGAPLFSGIIAGAIGGIVIGLLSKSPLSVSGPAAGLTVIVLSAIQSLPTYETFLLSVFIAGLLQILLGVVKAGIIGDFIPSSVIKGMLASIGIILILKQIPHLVGYDKDYEGDFAFFQPDGENTFSELWHLFDAHFTVGAVIIGVLSLAFLFWWDAIAPKRRGILQLVPGPLVVVLFGVLLNSMFQAVAPNLMIGGEHLVNIPVPDSVSSFLGQFKMMSLDGLSNPKVWTIALTIGLVASIESLLSLEAVDRIDPYKRNSPPNRELIAQGVGNILNGLLGGMPVTSVIVRSSANVSSGAKTSASTIAHGILLIAFSALIPSILNLIPLSALAAVLIATGYKLAKPSLFISERNKGLSHIVPFVVTIASILLTDLLVGVVIGIFIGGAFVLIENYKSAITVVSNDDNTYLVRIRKDLSFVHKYELKRALSELPDNAKVWINLSHVGFVDLDNAEILNDFLATAHFRGIQVEVKTPENKTVAQHINLPKSEL
jgi:carbonic anhydrase